MILPEFEYMQASSVEEAISLSSQLGPEAKLMAGGTDVVVLMKEHVIAPKYIIDLKGIKGLDEIKYEEGKGLTIGALAKLRDIQGSSVVAGQFQAVCDAAHFVASNQIRCKGTMVGNICNASPSCDTAPILIALGAEIETERPEGNSRIPVEEMFLGPMKTKLVPGEIVTAIKIPERKKGQGAAYIKHAYRKAMDLAIVGVAASVTVENGVCTDAKIGLGAVAATPIRSKAAEAVLIGKKLTEEVVAEAANAAMNECSPITDVRASAEYRKDMIRVFTKRALNKAIEDIRD